MIHADVQNEDVTDTFVEVQGIAHAAENIAVQSVENVRVDGDGVEEPESDQVGEDVGVEGSVQSDDVVMEDQGSVAIVEGGVQMRLDEQAAYIVIEEAVENVKEWAANIVLENASC